MTVDHIKRRSMFPELALDPANLQTLCGTCHGQAKQAHELAAGDVLASGSSSSGWPVDPGHPWNLAASAAPAARLAPPRPQNDPRGRFRPGIVPRAKKPA